MENEIKENDYVRLKTGEIFKVDENCAAYLNYDPNERERVKHSPNLIDIIEEGDYVNGKRIDAIIDGFLKSEGVREKVLCFEIDFPIEKGLRAYHDCDIESIVTKEQFESISYKVTKM